VRRALIGGLMVAAALVTSSAVALAAAPRPYTANYDVLRNGQPLGKATVSFTAQPGGGYEMRSITRGTEGLAAIAGVSIDEVSTLRLAAGRLETTAYTYQQKLAFKSPKDRSVRVDASTGRITSLDKGQSTSLKYQPGVLDRSAVTVALVQDLAAGKTGDLTYPVVDRESVSQQRYRPVATETLGTAMGKLRAVRVERIRDSGDGRTTMLWLGADKNFVPLRIVQTEANGETIEMRVTGIK
jgi:hypothetical protein